VNDLKERIIFSTSRELTFYDELAIKFSRVLEKLNVKYVIVAGFAAILLGRLRETEDIDFIIEPTDIRKIYKEARKEGFEALTPISSLELDFNEARVRFYLKPHIIPNIEVKKAKSIYDFYTLKNRVVVLLNEYKLYIAPPEIQIPYKLWLGSLKDLEDAKYTYMMLKEKINAQELSRFLKEFNVEELFRRIIET